MATARLQKCLRKDGCDPHNTFNIWCTRKKYERSSLSENVIEAGGCASESLDKVMSGKHFNRAMCVHKVTLEAD